MDISRLPIPPDSPYFQMREGEGWIFVLKMPSCTHYYNLKRIGDPGMAYIIASVAMAGWFSEATAFGKRFAHHCHTQDTDGAERSRMTNEWAELHARLSECREIAERMMVVREALEAAE